MITIGQRLRYFPLQHRAWAAHCDQNGLDASDHKAEQAWRHAEQLSVTGKESTGAMDPIKDFDAMMLHWAQIAGDDAEIKYWSAAVERRMKRRVRIAMQQLAELEGRVVTWDYVRAIQYQMNIPSDFEDCPAELLWKVYQALDTHVRRLRNRKAAANQTHAA